MNKAVNFKALADVLEGDLYTDDASKIMYATDASAYREIPVAVARPRNESDIIKLTKFAARHALPLIPRAAGTSLAGQVVGAGLVADVSKYMTKILSFDKDKKQVTVQPGVVRDELNQFLRPHGLFFSPETSTSNRCNIGGMVGNNACGMHSLLYGSTREHTIALKAVLSDGSTAVFKELSRAEFHEKTKLKNLEGRLYRNIYEILSNPKNQDNISEEFPHPEIKRRNTGYALDILLNSEIFSDSDNAFNFCKLLAGSEGTLAFISEITLSLNDLMPPETALLAVHSKRLEHAFEANLIALKYNPAAIELTDDIILEQSRKNTKLAGNAPFLKGRPKALLMVKFAEHDKAVLKEKAELLSREIEAQGYGYYFPLLFGEDIKKILDLRKAGLGLLSNIPGDAKPVAVTEDTAVRPEDLPEYMKEFNALMKKHGLSCVQYAHIATGELHLRPIINLKTQAGNELFKTVAEETARLVKKYRGSLSGEHGDGRLRGEFIPIIIGEENYELLRQIKKNWDPSGIFNPGKITDSPPMNESLRYRAGQLTPDLPTVFDYSVDMGYLRSAEKCTGSGDCRKSAEIGGTMCPSFQADKDEYNSTRARANILREYITQSQSENPFDQAEIIRVLDLCLSCKACKSECPANVDMTKLKAEALQHYYDAHAVPVRSRIIANLHVFNRMGIFAPRFVNYFLNNSFFSKQMKSLLGFARERSFPKLHSFTFKAWAARHLPDMIPQSPKSKVLVFNDEFTNYNDVEIGIAALKVLCALGYEPVLPKHEVSGRTYLSKGLLRKAKRIAVKNINYLSDKISPETPLLGIEPSAILTFRDEYPDFFKPGSSLRQKAEKMSRSCFTFEEFIAKEADKGQITDASFTKEKRSLIFHGHCYQKALSKTDYTKKVLNLPENYQVEEIPSGCCGMAGAFGFEKEHYELSQKVGELILFPVIRKSGEEKIIVAAGTSCRQQIKEGTMRQALHPAQVLLNALNLELRKN
jgi:FAD/FMN-containing dehydrogenase/Fe-S oxidoreductase